MAGEKAKGNRKAKGNTGEITTSTPTATRTTVTKKDADGVKMEACVPAGETWKFLCVKTCYWDGHICRGIESVPTPSAATVEFVGPCDIPKSFQFQNWKRVS